MLCLVSGCNLVASKASFICIKLIFKQWNFSGSERQLTLVNGHGFEHKVTHFYRKRFQGVAERSKMPRTQSLQVVIA